MPSNLERCVMLCPDISLNAEHCKVPAGEEFVSPARRFCSKPAPGKGGLVVRFGWCTQAM